MNVMTLDNVLSNPKEYVSDIFSRGFQDIFDGVNTFKNIQPRDNNDEFASFISSIFINYKINYNFVRMSPLSQIEPNFIHKDDMMGDVTCILYLSESHPEEDGTSLYDEDENVICKVYSRFNRLLVFDADTKHSRNIFENFGNGNEARLIQVIFLKESK
jgi:hypothetical protein